LSDGKMLTEKGDGIMAKLARDAEIMEKQNR
jgi:hypothetical protein